MVKIIVFDEIDAEDIVERIKQGEIFIYPTDTVYSLGCNALKPASVDIIRQLKRKDPSKPLAVVAPSKKWIFKNLIVKRKSYIQTLPGPFTFVLKMKKRCVARNVNPGTDVLGVRMPYHPFAKLIQKADVPFITTSITLFGQKPIREVSKIPKSLLKKVNVVVDGGFLVNHPSTVIDITEDMARIIGKI